MSLLLFLCNCLWMSFLNVLVQIARSSIWFITIQARIAHPFMHAKNMLFKVMLPIEGSPTIATGMICMTKDFLSIPNVRKHPSAMSWECLNITTRRWNLVHSHWWTTTHNQAIEINWNMDIRSEFMIKWENSTFHATLYFQTRLSKIETIWQYLDQFKWQKNKLFFEKILTNMFLQTNIYDRWVFLTWLCNESG